MNRPGTVYTFPFIVCIDGERRQTKHGWGGKLWIFRVLGYVVNEGGEFGSTGKLSNGNVVIVDGMVVVT